jgi:membrane fusion protein (multidrug efflux system)
VPETMPTQVVFRRHGLAFAPSTRGRLVPLMFAALFGAAACGSPAPTAVATGPVEVDVVETRATDVPIYAEFIGTLDGNVNTEVRARVPGFVTAVGYTEGTAVKAGQTLFTIDPQLADAAVTRAFGEVEVAKAALTKAEADVERLKPLAASNAVSRQELDNATAAAAMARASIVSAQGNLKTAQANLGFTKVTSPIDGVAGFAKARVGSLVGQGEPTLLTTVSQLDPIRLRFTISEQLYLRFAADLKRIAADTTTEGQLDMLLADGSVYPKRGKIAVVDRQIDPATGSITLEALFPNPDGLLRPGQFAKIRGVTETKKGVVLVPQRAVRELQGLTQVMVVGEGDKVELRTVVMGPRVGSLWVIESGLKPAERVIVEGLQKARPDAVVAPRVVPLPPLSAESKGGPASGAARTAAPAASAPTEK